MNTSQVLAMTAETKVVYKLFVVAINIANEFGNIKKKDVPHHRVDIHKTLAQISKVSSFGISYANKTSPHSPARKRTGFVKIIIRHF